MALRNFRSSIRFYLFKHEGCWEVHFSNDDGDLSLKHPGAGASRIFATAIKLLFTKIKGTTAPARLYADDPKKTELYLLLAKRFLGDRLIYQKISPVTGADGRVYPYGYIIKADTRSFALESFLARLAQR